MRRRLAAIGAVAAIAVLAVATTSPGGDGDGAVALTETRSLRSMDFQPRSSDPIAAARGTRQSGVRGLHLRYFRTAEFPVPANGRDDSFLLCPRRFKAISGFFNTTGGVVTDASFSGPGLRRWNFGLIDLTGTQGAAYLGIVCLSGIGQ